MSHRRTRSLRNAVRPVAELLERRALLCDAHMLANLPDAPQWSDALEAEARARSAGGTVIVWANRNQASDNFNTTFGTKAEQMRGIVDAALLAWQQVITDWNRSDGTVGLQVNIRMTGGGFGGAAAPERDPPGDGKPRTGSVDLGGGNGSTDPNDTNGWFADPSPFDNGEFIGSEIKSAFVGENTADAGPDFFSLVTIEMAHVLGLISDRNNDGGDWGSYRLENFVTNTGIADSTHNSNGKFFTFDGPGIDHLMTGFNGGDGPPNSWGNVVHSANAPADINFAGKNWRGTDDVGNGSGDFGLGSPTFGFRYLPSFSMANLFKDAYAYSIAEPASFGTMYAVINETTGRLTIRGATGNTNSADVITVSFINGDTIRVTVDIGNDTPGSGAFSGVGNLPAFVTDFLAIGVTEIVIKAGDGNDTINIESLPFFAEATVIGGLGDDSIAIGGSSRNLANVDAPIFVDGDFGVDVVNLNDQSATGPRTFSLSADQLTAPALVSFTRVEDVTINAGPFNDNISITGSAVGTALGASGNLGDDIISIGGGDFGNMLSAVAVNGSGGSDTIRFLGSSDADLFTATLRNNGFVTGGLTHSYINFEAVDIRGGPGGSDLLIQSVPALTLPAISLTNFTGGSGDDLVTIGTGNVLVAGNVLVNGGSGSDTLLLDDSSGTSSSIYTFDLGNRFFKTFAPAMFTVVRSAIEQTILDANGGNNTITVDRTTSALTILANAGNDTIHVLDSTTPVTVHSGSETTSASAPFGDSIAINTDFAVSGDTSATVVIDQDDSVLGLTLAQSGTLRIDDGAVLEKSAGTGSALTLNGTLDFAGGAYLHRAGQTAVDFRTLLTRGYAAGAWNGTNASGAFNSSLAAGSSLPDAVGYGLGSEIAINNIGGFSIGAGDMLIRYTLYGDADLNGSVNFDDYARTDNGFVNQRSGWVNGDFDFNNVVNFDDYALIDQAFLGQGTA